MLNDYTNNGHIVKFNENPLAILVVTPIMQRAHTLAFSKDIAFVDSTSSCDTQSHSVTFMLTSCGIGAVPLGMFITKGQTTDDYKAAFTLLKDSVPCSFGGHGFPKQFIIDDSEAERQALRAIWPESSIFLCRFHVLQSVWRWLWDSKHDIRNEDRKLLFKLFQTILNASNNSSASEAYSIAIEVWCLAFRDASVHGNQTNNFSEVNVRIFKDIVLSRNKAYNAVALVDFFCTSLEEYYLRRLRTFVNSRNDTARLLFQDQLKRYINKNAIEKLPNNLFKVPSETNSGFYEVDVTYECCNCSKRNLGAFCNHQAAVYHHFNTSMPNLPAITVNCRLLLAKLAFGEHVPDKLFYMPLVCKSDSDKINESLNEATPGNYEKNEPSCCKIPTTLTNQALEVDSNSNSEYYAEQIQELFKSNLERYTSSTSVSVLSKCLDRLKKVKSAASWESFMSTAGSNISLRHRTRATIRVQPTAINRRKLGITRGSKRLPLGRPLNADINRKRKEKNLGENVQKNVPNAKSRGTGH
ncbi:unnamed protein product [Macrosiphum euphorbiae]|uniref:SWIM-type domain-containing protein n=1 Tax=Macrosiphum euphorbiae TaxID=13131 RepID=A0AAV0Y657_9HEMI|nr:unnamed protein product [Macrosiphum euphorbiae]